MKVYIIWDLLNDFQESFKLLEQARMLELHARFSCLVLPIIVLLIVFTIYPFQNYLQIGNCIGKLNLVFRFQIAHEFEEGLFLHKNIGAPFEILEILIIRLFGWVENLFYGGKEAFISILVSDDEERVVDEFGENRLFEGLKLILSGFVLAS